MSKSNEKYELEFALEKFIVKLGRDIHRLVHFATHIPKSRRERRAWMQEIIIWFIGVIMWTYIVAWGFHQVGN